MAKFIQHEPCPICSSKDNLARYSDNGAYCFGCGYYEIGQKGQVRPGVVAQHTFTPKYYKGPLGVLSPGMFDYLQHVYGIWPSSLLGAREVPQEMAVVFPVESPLQRVRGELLRRFTPMPGQSKTLTFKHQPGPMLAWYREIDRTHLVVVEDTLSAIRCWQLGYTACALLGATISPDKWQEIYGVSKGCTGNILLALDRDKFSEAVGYAKKYPLQPVLLDADLKDCTDDEILEKLDA